MLFDEHRLVAEARGIERRDRPLLLPRPPVPARKHGHAVSAREEELADGDDCGGLPGAPHGEVAEGDERRGQALPLQQPATVEGASCAIDAAVDQLQRFEKRVHGSSSTIRSAVRAEAPRFCSTVRRARSPIEARAAWSSSRRSASANTSRPFCTSVPPPSRRKTEAISRKFDICGPKQTGTPAAAASMGLWPPVAARLPPMNPIAA